MRRKYDFEDLKQCRYPNLVAEFMETGYSICTLDAHMGLGRHRPENDPEINAKLFGDGEITYDEAVALARLFNCGADYLFSEELKEVEGLPFAYVRHCDENKREEKGLDESRMLRTICEELKENRPDWIPIFYELATLPEESLELRMRGSLKGIDGLDKPARTWLYVDALASESNGRKGEAMRGG